MKTQFSRPRFVRGLWLAAFTVLLAVSAANAQSPILCGQTITNSISAAAEVDQYTYVGSAGETLTFGFVGSGSCAGGQNAIMDLYNPANQLIASLSYCGVRSTNLTLLSSGTYTILVHDDNYTQISSYSLSIQSFTGGGCSSIPIVCGQTISTNLVRATEIDAFSYMGNSGETLVFGFVGSGSCAGGQNAVMDLYNPTGQKLASLSYCGVRSTNLTLTNSGTFTILVHDDDYAQVSSYSLSIQSFTGGGCSNIPIVCGQTISTNISGAAEIDAFSYVGNSGETLAFGFVGSGSCAGGQNAVMDLYNPTGQKLASLNYCGVRSTNLTLTNSGTFTILVHDDDYAQASSFSLSIQSFTGGGCGAVLPCNQTLNSQISLASEIDGLSLTAAPGALAVLSFNGFNGVQFDFYDPAGTKVFTGSSGSATNFTFGTAGTYTLLVHDDNYANTGSYSVALTCIGCIYSISPTSVLVGGTATNSTVNITAHQHDCTWSNTANVSWLTITGGLTGSGNGTVSYTVDANPTLNPRTGTMTIAGATFTVNQAGAFSLIGQDIGNPGAAGSLSYSNGTFSIRGSGEDIEDTADDFYFVHQLLQGDGVIIARMASFQPANSRSEAGVMMRETTSSGSRHVFLTRDAAEKVSFRRRLVASGLSVETGQPGTNSLWLRLMRMGDTFVGHASTNGNDWQYVWFTTLNMSSQLLVGMAVTAHNFASLATAQFDNVSIGSLSPLSGEWPLSQPQILLGGELWSSAEFARVGGFKFLVGSGVGDVFSILSSPDIGIPVASWPVLGSVTNTYGVVPFLDSQALTNAHRYYRAEKVIPLNP